MNIQPMSLEEAMEQIDGLAFDFYTGEYPADDADEIFENQVKDILRSYALWVVEQARQDKRSTKSRFMEYESKEDVAFNSAIADYHAAAKEIIEGV